MAGTTHLDPPGPIWCAHQCNSAFSVSRDEAEPAMREGYDESGQPDQFAALMAVMRATRSRSDDEDAADILKRRTEQRCSAEMPRAQ